MTRYDEVRAERRASPRSWLITGVAGFIGSNLLETLLKLDQRVVGLDNFATGHGRNLDEVKTLVEPSQWARFSFIEGNICDLDACRRRCEGLGFNRGPGGGAKRLRIRPWRSCRDRPEA